MTETEMVTVGIVWDVDGTLCNSHDLCFVSTNQVLLNHGRSEISEEEYHQGTRFTTPRRMAWHATKNPDDSMGEILGKEFDDMYVALVTSSTAPLYPGISELLSTIQNRYSCVKFGAFSNACTDYVEAVLNANNIRANFDVALGADAVPCAKPAPDGLLLCASRLGTGPELCIYVGDSPTDGMAANNAKMHSIGVTWGSHSTETVSPHFAHIVHSVDELSVVLQQYLNQRLSLV